MDYVEKVFGYVDRIFKAGEDNQFWLITILGIAVLSRMMKFKVNVGGGK